MGFPSVPRIELPILQELMAMGGTDDVRFLYERLLPYFPQISRADDVRERWRLCVQRAGRALDEKREIERRRPGVWTITLRGRKRAGDEETQFALLGSASGTDVHQSLTHEDAQRMLVEIGQALGRFAQREFQYYDVIWRASEKSPRITHVFEVQRKGSIDAALVKLKRAYEAQRSKPFLIVASELDTNRARRELSLDRLGAFHEIERATIIISFEQLSKMHRALLSVGDLLADFLD
ncbi:MAG: hypothetical protein WKF30_15005 [Pyrinomonadaceae bacterium]